MRKSFERGTGEAAPPQTLKILVAGGFGVGKTTFVGSVSEITPLRTEERLTSAAASVDDLTGIPEKISTTVAMDFGRITLDEAVLLMFGTPGQDRFWFMWRDLVQGALGAVVLVDSRRLDLSFPSIDFFEKYRLPYVVAANCFHGEQDYSAEQIGAALAIDPTTTPVLMFDARQRADVRTVLLALMDRVIARHAQPTVGT